jgi:hypothetical protein
VGVFVTAENVAFHILPKLDLTGFLKSKVVNQDSIILKKIFSFYLKLIIHVEEPIIRKRAIKDLCSSLFWLYNQRLDFQDSDSVLLYIAEKLENFIKALQLSE